MPSQSCIFRNANHTGKNCDAATRLESAFSDLLAPGTVAKKDRRWPGREAVKILAPGKEGTYACNAVTRFKDF
jgi:hypothetical protein